MTRSNDDTKETDLVAGYILNDLSPEEVDHLNQALVENQALAEELDAFQEAIALLPYDMPLLEPSTRLRDKIISAASQSITSETVDTRDQYRYYSCRSYSIGFEPSSTESSSSANCHPSAKARRDEY
jgi:hypothetical protein